MQTIAKLAAPLIAIFGLLIVFNQADARQQRRGGRAPDVFKFLTDKYDKNHDGKLSRGEYDRSDETFTRFDTNKDGTLTAEDWAGKVRGRRRPHGGGRHDAGAAPAVGDDAPDFALAYVQDKSREVRLSSFVGSKPVALIFGSCT